MVMPHCGSHSEDPSQTSSIADNKTNIVCIDSTKCNRKWRVAYFVLIVTTWAWSVATSVFCTLFRFDSTRVTSVWNQNYLHPTVFTMDGIVGSLYWMNLFVRQLLCLGFALTSPNPTFMDAIVSTGNYIIVFNLLHLVSVILFVHSYFAGAEVLMVLNFANMSALYFRYNRYPLLLHSSLVSGPLSWTFFALYWNGFRIFPQSDIMHIIGLVFLWGMLGYGLFFATIYKDFSICLFLSLLATSVGVYHGRAHSDLQQCIPPFVIAGGLLIAAAVLNVLRWAKKRKIVRTKNANSQKEQSEVFHKPGQKVLV